VNDAVQKFVEGLPPKLPIREACKVGRFSRRQAYHLAGLRLIKLVKILSRTYVDTQSLLDYLDNLPSVEVKAPEPRRPRKPAVEPTAVESVTP
jgi:hypothetical protein